jgi:hypothetical protein
MRKPVSLTLRESISFLRVVHSFFLRDEKLSPVETEVLSMLVAAFQIKVEQQKEFQVLFFSNVESMAEEINKISDPNVRLYLLAIIYELYLIEKQSSPRFSGHDREIFESTYNSLLRLVNIENADVETLVSITDSSINKPEEKANGMSGFSAGLESLKDMLGLGLKK